MNYLKKFINVLILFCLTLVIVSFIINPFNTSSIYSFSLSRWSHVLFSRIIGLAILISIIFDYPYNKYKTVILILLTVGIIYSGARGPFMFIVAFYLYYTLIIKKKFNHHILLVISISFLMYYITLLNDSNQRILEIFNINDLINSPSIIPRLVAIEKGFNIIDDNFWMGIGIGGFNSELIGDIGKNLRYPHNILIESICELGIFGLILILLIFFMNINFLYKNFKYTTYLFIYALYLSLFSKDISSNPILFSLIFFHLKLAAPSSFENNIFKRT